MTVLPIILFSIAWFIFAYYWYGGIIKRKVILSDDNQPTPSHQQEDGIDYVPSKTSILFGHHFSSIAGAGPIVGPILAFAYFGWLPAVIWILVGSVFMGAVHDYTALMVSVRNKGVSIVEVSDKVLSKKSRAIFAAFVWITLMLIQAVFADLVAKTMVQKPSIVIPTFGIIFIALLFGYFVFKKGFNNIAGTVIALLMLLGTIQLGDMYPIEGDYQVWLFITFLYSYLASILPVQILLQPRDYLTMFILIFGLLLGFVGVAILNPEINAPAVTGFNSSNGPLFPILFITIACGAISGFHSLVSSGTSSKQLNKESDGRKVAYGGMLMEGVLALLVIVMISSTLTWSPDGAGGEFVFQTLLKKSAILVFGSALGLSSESLGVPLVLGIMFGVMMMKAFILTTLDTSARLNRYVMEETLGASIGGIFKNKHFATLSSLLVAYALCLFDGYKVLWPMFGASNQLIATLALFVISAYLFGFKIPKWYTLIPAVIMLFVTESALIYQAFWVHMPNNAWHLVTISVLLFVLGLVVAWESVGKIKKIGLENLQAAKS